MRKTANGPIRKRVSVHSDQRYGLRTAALRVIRASVTATGLLILTVCGESPSDSSAVPKKSPTSTLTQESPLTRRDAPPQGVLAQFELFLGGNGICEETQSEPSITIFYDEPEIATIYGMCFPGFTSEEEIRVQVKMPNGRVREGIADPDVGLDWFSTPGDPLGEYEVTATQGTSKETGTFTVRPASKPRILILTDKDPLTLSSTSTSGTSVQLAVAGFRPASVVSLDLYAEEENNTWKYATTLLAKMDKEGQTVYELRTSKDDPAGKYCIVYRRPNMTPDEDCNVYKNVLFVEKMQ